MVQNTTTAPTVSPPPSYQTKESIPRTYTGTGNNAVAPESIPVAPPEQGETSVVETTSKPALDKPFCCEQCSLFTCLFIWDFLAISFMVTAGSVFYYLVLLQSFAPDSDIPNGGYNCYQYNDPPNLNKPQNTTISPPLNTTLGTTSSTTSSTTTTVWNATHQLECYICSGSNCKENNETILCICDIMVKTYFTGKNKMDRHDRTVKFCSKDTWMGCGYYRTPEGVSANYTVTRCHCATSKCNSDSQCHCGGGCGGGVSLSSQWLHFVLIGSLNYMAGFLKFRN